MHQCLTAREAADLRVSLCFGQPHLELCCSRVGVAQLLSERVRLLVPLLRACKHWHDRLIQRVGQFQGGAVAQAGELALIRLLVSCRKTC